MEIHSLQELDQALRNGMVLAIDDGTVTSKVDVTTIERHAIESYAGSTLAGAAQSVKAALDGIKTDLDVVYGANPIKTLAATDDLLTLDVGMYRVANVLPLNAPSTTYKYGYATKQHRGASGYTYYEFIVGNGNGNDFKRYYGWQYSNSATSIDWIEMAPQSAVDELNSNFGGMRMYMQNTNALSYSFTLSDKDNSRHSAGLFFGGTANGREFCYLLWINATSNLVTITKLYDGLSARVFEATYDASTKVLTIQRTDATESGDRIFGGIRLIIG